MKDPVCGMNVKEPPVLSAQWNGETYGFCNPRCKEKFLAEPGKYGSTEISRRSSGKAARPEPVSVEPAALYSCPMDPEVIQQGPGGCPKCGMALEPLEPSAEGAPNPELKEMTRRFWASLLLTLPVFGLAMGEMFVHGSGRASWILWVQFLFATPVVLWGGAPFFQRGGRSVLNRSPNMFTLIALGTGVAYLYSAAAALAPGLFPPTFRDAGGRVAVYFESAAVIVTLVLLGQVMELRAREKTSDAVKKLLNLAPKTARRLRPDGEEEDVPLAMVRAGDRLRVRPGESVPADGEVVEGRSAVDESLVTGESFPIEKSPGSPVTGGTVNGTGGLVMRAEKVGADTLLARIVRLVTQAQRSRAPIQGVADRVAALFVPAVVAFAAAAFVVWGLWGPAPRLGHALVNAVAVLIIACPCALGLATPMSVMVGVGRGALAGVLIRNAEALERLERVDALVVDKTGTLTEGKPRVTSVEGGSEVLALAAALERGSEHPLASAVLEEARARKIEISAAENFRSVTGQGVTGTVGGRPAALGNRGLMDSLRIDSGDWERKAEDLRREGGTVVFLAVDGVVRGIIGVADPVKESAREALGFLKDAGIRVILATGDNETTARAVARRLGIDDVRAGVKPEDKAELVASLKKMGKVVAMAGDGVNDAPALALADVGIAMGSGTDIAMESSGITLVKGDLRGIAKARRLSRTVMRNIRQNLFFAFFYNAVGVPVAAGLLYPFFGILLSPMIAAAAMSFSSVSVIGNALRIRAVRL